MDIQRPASLREAVQCAAGLEGEAKFIAGGTAVVLMLQQGLIAPAALISLGGLEDVPDYRMVFEEGGRLIIGAGVLLSDVASSPHVLRSAPDLAHAVSQVGNIRVRNAATLCGNIAEADHSSDPPAVLVNRDADVVIFGPEGYRREPVSELIVDFLTTTLGPADVITGVEIPFRTGERSRYDKFRSRSTEDRPCVTVAATIMTDAEGIVTDLRVTVGAATAQPVRLDEVTAAAVGSRMSADVAAEVAAAYRGSIEPLTDARGSSWYRSQVIEVQVRRTLEQLVSVSA